jgi:ABC-type nitrate/sulfonate/bicarbonate transport system permease component
VKEESGFKSLFVLNGQPSGYWRIVPYAFTLLMLVVFWQVVMPSAIPNFGKILAAFPVLLEKQQLLAHWGSTFRLTAIAIFWSVLASLLISFLTVIPVFRLFVALITKMRFLSLVGISIVFVMLASNLHTARIYLLMFGIVPYMTTSILSVIISVEKLRLDAAKTLGLSPIQQVWHIQVREKAGDIADVIRQNLAMAFMMLTFVELRVREGGGVGVLLDDLHKNGHGYDEIFALQLSILLVGIALDALSFYLIRWAFPFAFINKQGAAQ